MTVGYKLYVRSEVFRMCRGETRVVLTETPSIKVKPGSSTKPNADIIYIICNGGEPFCDHRHFWRWDIPKCNNR